LTKAQKLYVYNKYIPKIKLKINVKYNNKDPGLNELKILKNTNIFLFKKSWNISISSKNEKINILFQLNIIKKKYIIIQTINLA